MTIDYPAEIKRMEELVEYVDSNLASLKSGRDVRKSYLERSRKRYLDYMDELNVAFVAAKLKGEWLE